MSRLRAIQVAVMCTGLLAVPGCRCGGSREPRAPAGGAPSVMAVTSVLAALPDGPQAPGPEHAFVFAERGGGVAWVVEEGGRSRVFHDGRAGEAYETVGSVALDPGGRRIAHGALVEGKWRMVVDGKAGAAFDAVETPLFSPDGAHVAYVARAGELWHVVVDGVKDGGARGTYQLHGFSGDSARIAFVEMLGGDGFGTLLVSDLALRERTVVSGRVKEVVRSSDGTALAAVGDREGGQSAMVVSFARPEEKQWGPTYDAVYSLTFGPTGRSIAYLAERAGGMFAVVEGREAPLSPGDSPVSLPRIRPDGRGLGIVVVAEGAVLLREFLDGGARAEPPYNEIEWLVYGGTDGSHAYAARKGEKWHLVVNGKEGPPFDRVVTPVFSPDGRFVVYRARQDGKRFVVVADGEGKTVRQHPPYEQVHSVTFTADGKSIAYGVKDGRALAWKVEPL